MDIQSDCDMDHDLHAPPVVRGHHACVAGSAYFWRYRCRARLGTRMRHFLQNALVAVPHLAGRVCVPTISRALIASARCLLSLPLGIIGAFHRAATVASIADPAQQEFALASGTATVDEVHATAANPPGWTSSAPRAIQDLAWWVSFVRGHLRGLGALTPGPRSIWGQRPLPVYAIARGNIKPRTKIPRARSDRLPAFGGIVSSRARGGPIPLAKMPIPGPMGLAIDTQTIPISANEVGAIRPIVGHLDRQALYYHAILVGRWIAKVPVQSWNLPA